MANIQTIQLNHVSREDILKAARFFAEWPGTCVLYSGGTFDSAQTSYLGLFPYESITVRHSKGNPWDTVRGFFDGRDDARAFGFFGYEMGAFSDDSKRLPYQPAVTPDAYWQRCGVVLIVDHTTDTAQVHLTPHTIPSAANWIDRLSTAQGWHDFLRGLPQTNNKRPTCLTLHSQSDDYSSYLKKIELVQELIREGEIYQVNLSQQFDFRGNYDPFHLFETLAHNNPAPFSAYLNLESFALVSTSPERFLQKKGLRLETRPIKGTIVRGKDAAEDASNRKALLASPKERAELLMITDLMRNDLGKVSQSGSVMTDEIWRCEAYANVFHLLSIIHSEAKPKLHTLDIIRHCFPGGSITGCPKLRAMEVINELEKRPRGVYTGSIGTIAGNGDFDLNIAIRTMVATPGSIQVQLGGGIVIDSIPQNEYEETLHKGSSIFKALGAI